MCIIQNYLNEFDSLSLTVGVKMRKNITQQLEFFNTAKMYIVKKLFSVLEVLVFFLKNPYEIRK